MAVYSHKTVFMKGTFPGISKLTILKPYCQTSSQVPFAYFLSSRASDEVRLHLSALGAEESSAGEEEL